MKLRRLVFSCWMIMLFCRLVLAGASFAAARELPVDSWLVAPPSPLALPALHEEPPRPVEAKDLLEPPLVGLDALWPAEGRDWHWPREVVKWEKVRSAESGLDLDELGDRAAAAEGRQALAAFYLRVDRFVDLTLRVDSSHPLQLFVDGKKVEEKTAAGGLEKQLPLERGKHRVLVRTVREPGSKDGWTLSAVVKTTDEAARIATDLSPRHALLLSDLLDARAIGGLELSDDGRYLAWRLSQPAVPADGRRSWWEIHAVADGSLVRSFEGEGGTSGFAWVPGEGHRYSFTTTKDGKTTLWIAGLQGQPTETIVEDIEHFGDYRWLPDASGVVFTMTEKGKEKHEDFKRYRNLADRWSDYRDKGYLYLASYPAGTIQRLTAGVETTSLLDISPDGRTVLFSRELQDKTERPFSLVEYYELDLDTLAARKIFQSKWSGDAAYSPDGRTLAVQGGPDAFGRIGVALPDSIIPNDYDQQLYLLDRKSGEVTPITLDFDPSIRSFRWSKKDGALYCTAETGSRVLLYRYDSRRNRFERLPDAGEVATHLAISRDGKWLAYVGESSNDPERIYVQKAQAHSKPRLMADPNGARYDRVELGKVEDWDFTTSDGTRIIGRIYYPPGFKPKGPRSWPCIVYYYGGTLPVTRDFGGRYPKNWWAANGYVVYVLQPSGATGFGQEFSARHVDDWGRRAGREILEGTEKFLAAHDFVDPERVGCLGASYGGFMTEYLVSHSELFAGAVSHAGISFLGSYWGQGDWGAFYSAVATAGKYPWNAPRFYQEQGSFFNADRIHTPLLLLHGDIDNNVPPGESEQLYTALKVLGREVEFIRIGGERHWILKYPHRQLWSRTIVAWFDRTLKGDRRWWDHLWGDDQKE